MTLVYLARQNKAVMTVTPEAVNLDQELGIDNLSTFFLCLALWLCMKMSSANRVLVVRLQIGAKDLTVDYAKKKYLRFNFQGKLLMEKGIF